MSMILKDDSIQIREVWKENLEAEMVLIREIVDKFPYVAMDTEFPGTVYKPVGTPVKPTNESTYETLRANVNLLKIIQLGLTFSDDKGNLPTCGLDNKYCIWQFNFREFDLTSDMYAHDSIELLRQSGIDFVKNRQNGVDSLHFADLLMSSGVVLNDDVHWVTFHGGYDFGYLLKLLTGKNLPQTQSGFLKMISVFFPRVYDVKHVMKFANGLYGGLNKLAQNLGVKRVGTSHQAGSDSLLTLCVFMKLQERYFIGSVDKYSGVLFGLGVENR